MRIRVERVIERPASQVAPFFFDVANNPTWQIGIESCSWTTDPPIAVGSQYEQVVAVRGEPAASTYEVTEFDPGRKLRVESIKSTFPIQVTRRVDPIGETSCRVSADVTGQTTGFLRILTVIGVRVAKRSIEADYDRLVEYFASAERD